MTRGEASMREDLNRVYVVDGHHGKLVVVHLYPGRHIVDGVLVREDLLGGVSVVVERAEAHGVTR